MIVIKLLFYSIVILFSFSFLLLYVNAHPPRYSLSRPPSEFGLEFEDVEFRTDDDVLLKGWFIPSAVGNGKRPAVVICHGLGANRSDFTDLANFLVRQGFHVLMFDFRAHGDSKGKRSSFGFSEKKDLAAAIRHLKERREVEPGMIGVYGFSMGAAVAIMAASEDDDIRAVVSDSSYTSLREQGINLVETAYSPILRPLIHPLLLTYRIYFNIKPADLSPLAVVSSISPRPLFIIGGGKDEQMPGSDAQRLYAAAGESKELWLIEGAVHGGTIYSAGSEYFRRVGKFFSSHLTKSEDKEPG